MAEAPPPRDLAPRQARRSHDFDESYATGTPPWDIGRPQRAFEHLARGGALSGRVLDVGCGTGEHALLAAAQGLETVGIDISGRAIEVARQKAADRGLEVRFLVGDALKLPELGATFDTVLDCGLFHTFDDDDRGRFVTSLASVIPAGGRYHMLCFNDRQPGDWGPRRVSEHEIRMALASGWALESVEAAVLDTTIDPAGAAAWHVVARRT